MVSLIPAVLIIFAVWILVISALTAFFCTLVYKYCYYGHDREIIWLLRIVSFSTMAMLNIVLFYNRYCNLVGISTFYALYTVIAICGVFFAAFLIMKGAEVYKFYIEKNGEIWCYPEGPLRVFLWAYIVIAIVVAAGSVVYFLST